MDLNFSASGIISSLLFSIIGIWLYKQGKKNLNIPVVFIGITLMIYSYFTSGPLADWGVGVALCALAYFLWNR